MSTPTTARGALLRRAGTLLVAAALVGAPATSAFADPTASPTASPTADAGPTASASASPTPTATAAGRPDPHDQPVGHHVAEPEPSPAPSPSASATPTAPGTHGRSLGLGLTALLPGGRTSAVGPAAAAGPTTSSDPALVAAHYLEAQLAATGYLLQSSASPTPA